jgi:hypothetical protein
MSSLAESPIPESVRAVLALFEGPLAEVRFPKVDGQSLATRVAEVEQQRLELSRALEAVAAARKVLEQGQQALLEQARQAHAYATVYAHDDPTLTEQLAAIKLDTRPSVPAKKRGRPPKSAQTQTSLDERPRPAARPGKLVVSENAA